MKKIAVIGVTESVGREILAFLADGGYRPSETAALETKVPLGTQVSFGEEEDIDVGNLEDFDFAEAEIAIFAASEEISRRYAARALPVRLYLRDCIRILMLPGEMTCLLQIM